MTPDIYVYIIIAACRVAAIFYFYQPFPAAQKCLRRLPFSLPRRRRSASPASINFHLNFMLIAIY